jgi:hypothetical protein
MPWNGAGLEVGAGVFDRKPLAAGRPFRSLDNVLAIRSKYRRLDEDTRIPTTVSLRRSSREDRDINLLRRRLRGILK